MLMLHYDLWGTRRTFRDLNDSLGTFWRHEPVREELHELLGILDARSTTLTRPSNLAANVPLHVHATYSRDEILGAYGEGSPAQPPQFREGVRHIPSASTDVLLVTLKKAERDYSPTTLYRDYAISPERFHWESQSTASAGSATIQRYEQHAGRRHTIVPCSSASARRSRAESGRRTSVLVRRATSRPPVRVRSRSRGSSRHRCPKSCSSLLAHSPPRNYDQAN
jgi:hypothetical protein